MATTSTRVMNLAGDFVELTLNTLDLTAFSASLQTDRAGAKVIFAGTTRDSFQGRRVTRLEYEAYQPLAEGTIVDILNCARSLPDLEAVRPEGLGKSGPLPGAPNKGNNSLIQCGVLHRLGEVPVGEISILVGVSSVHRKEAFIACEYILEEVKSKAQIWKREWYGESVDDAQWKANHER